MYWLLFIILQVLCGSLSIDSGENNTIEVELFMKQFENATIFPVYMMRESTNDIKTDGIQEYVNRIKKKGVELIKNTVRQIIREFNMNNNLTNIVETISSNYEKEIENYANSNYISNVKLPPYAESLYMFLDVLNTAYLHLYHDQTKVFKDMLKKPDFLNTSTTDNGLNHVTLHNIVIKQCFSLKTKELLHMCNNYQVCRPYSAFTGDLMQFVYQILSLTDSEFKEFIKILKEIIEDDEDFRKLVAGNEDIIKAVDRLFLDPGNIKESLEVLRALLKHRYKMIRIPDLKRQRKIQAARMMLDIIDRTLSFDHNEDISFEIDKATNAIKDWAKGRILANGEDSLIHISDFINSIFSTMLLSENAFIPILIEAILTSKIEKIEAYKGLFQDGTKNVYANKIINE